MQYEFRLPETGSAVVEMVNWEVREGETVAAGQIVCKVLAGRNEIDIPCPQGGILRKQVARIGDQVRASQILALVKTGEGPDGDAAGAAAPGHGNSADASAPALPGTPGSESPVVAAPPGEPGGGPTAVTLSTGTRSRGGGSVSGVAGVQPQDRRMPFAEARKLAANALTRSWINTPHAYSLCEADVTAMRGLIRELQGEASKRGCELGESAFVLRGLARTLREFPDFNSHMFEGGDGLVWKGSCDVGIALAAGQGLVVPVIRDVQRKDLWALAGELGALPARVRDNCVADSELRGATFTATFVTSASSSLYLPVVRQPETASLGVTRVQERAVVVGTSIQARWRMSLGLSYDQRAHDPSDAVAFLNDLVSHLESPRSLV